MKKNDKKQYVMKKMEREEVKKATKKIKGMKKGCK